MKDYKGYSAAVEVTDDVLHGEIIGIRDVVTFEAESVPALQRAFEESVDDYLEFCASEGVKPEKSFSGQFLIRTTPDLHRRVHAAAATAGESVNAWVAGVLNRNTVE